MDVERRSFLKGLGGVLFLSLADIAEIGANQRGVLINSDCPVNIIIPKDYDPLKEFSARDAQYKLSRAILEVLQANFGNQTMPVWGKYFREIDLEKRVNNIIYWVLKAVETSRKIYPVDIVWILAQIMKESYYCEFAVSRSLAVGVCQFIQPTAKAHHMLCAGEKPEHSSPAYKLPEFAGEAGRYYRLRSERNSYRSRSKPSREFTLEESLQIISAGNSGNYSREAGQYLSYLERLKKYDDQMQQAQDNYKSYLAANTEGKDIFNDNDLEFILNFDERLTYKKPVYGMVEIIAKGLRARNGNILAATSGYNAGLSNTIDEGMYQPYGKIPAIEESATYVSHVLINHYEISRRMG